VYLQVEGGEYSLTEPLSTWVVSSNMLDSAFSDADYLIVTKPPALFANYDDNAVNELLATMAELAKEKNGVLGHICYGGDAGSLKHSISPGGAWYEKLTSLHVIGDFDGITCMAPGPFDYLLLVGEAPDIVPSFDWPCEGKTVRITDYPYSNISGDEQPELKVGRIIGRTAQELIKPIQASIDVYKHIEDYDASDALLISGPEGGWEWFVKDAEIAKDKLTGKGVNVGDNMVHTEYYNGKIVVLRYALRIGGGHGDDTNQRYATSMDELSTSGSWDNGYYSDDHRWTLNEYAAWLLWAEGRLENISKEYAISNADSLITDERLDEAMRIAERIQADRSGRGGTYGWWYTYFEDRDGAKQQRFNEIYDRAANKDIILFTGHGNSGSWPNVLGPTGSLSVERINFGNTRPIVIAFSCLTGNYGDNNSIARAFLKNNAAVYIGATEASNSGWNDQVMGELLWRHWSKTSRIGDALFALKSELIQSGWQPFVYKYNLYGDPKFGGP